MTNRSQDSISPSDAEVQAQQGVRKPDPEWIGEILGASIRSLEARLLGESRGFQSTTWHLRLEAEIPGSCPASVILKSETSDADFQAFSRLNNAFGREVGVYTHITPQLENHQPRVYGCHDGETSWLLIEDLTHLRSGDQVIGLSLADTLDSVRRMGRLHARFWMDPALEDHQWLPLHRFWFGQLKPEITDDFFRTYATRFGTEVCRLYRAVQEQSDAIDQAINARPWTLVHGDLRADNLLFDGDLDDPEAVIIDWSWAARSLGAIDTAFLVGGSTPLAQRLGHHEELLEAWHGSLLEGGVRDYPLQEARRDLQLCALRAMTTCETMHSFDRGAVTAVRAALFMDDAIQRHAAYAHELRAWEALPDPKGF
jgi:Ecdysteroid kinase-like family